MTQTNNWKANYDVVVLGFGGAGATAARFAADNGAKVLIVDAAPYGHEGGNTRYSAQLIATANNLDKIRKYYRGLTNPLDLSDEIIDVFTEGMTNIHEYVKKYLGVEPVSFTNDFKFEGKSDVPPQEYPELEGNETMDYTMVSNGWFNAALWKKLREEVLKRKDSIDVWYDARAVHLIQDEDSKVIKGAQIVKDGQTIDVLAKRGVVLTTGGFEDNKEMIQNYLGVSKLSPLGTLYNRGDGIKMAQEVNAKLWHMWNYETLGVLHGISFDTSEGKRAKLILSWNELSHGSIFMIADDGMRYFDESEANRHGHIKDHGQWRVPKTHEKPYIIFDQTQYEEIQNSKIPYDEFNQKLIKAESILELSNKIGVNPKGLEKQVKIYNQAAETGSDIQFNRTADSMRAFDDGPYYAIKMGYDVLNTQGGPQRNAKAQILDLNEKPIAHLFGSGELGGICTNQYQGGMNLAECLIFGKIAGENAAKVTDEVNEDASDQYNGINELVDGNQVEDVSLAENQSLGSSDAGIGGKLVVRVTQDGNRISNVEIIQDHESEDVGKKALEELPKKIVEANSTDVDAVSGASSTSRAIKEAVKDALSK